MKRNRIGWLLCWLLIIVMVGAVGCADEKATQLKEQIAEQVKPVPPTLAYVTGDGVTVLQKEGDGYETQTLENLPPGTVPERITARGDVLLLSGVDEEIGMGWTATVRRTEHMYLVRSENGADRVVSETALPGIGYVHPVGLGVSAQCIVLVRPPGDPFSPASLEGTGDEYGEVYLADAMAGTVHPVHVDGEPLKLAPVDFVDYYFNLSTDDELVYLDRQQIYLGAVGDGPVDLRAFYRPADSLKMWGVGYVAPADCFIMQAIRQDKWEVWSINRDGEGTLLMVSDDLIPHGGYGVRDCAAGIKGTPYFHTYIDGFCAGREPGSWLVNAETGEHRYLGSALVSSRDGRWYLETADEPESEGTVWRWDNAGGAYKAVFTLPGWVDYIKVVPGRGGNLIAAVRWDFDHFPLCDLYIYDPISDHLEPVAEKVSDVV